MTAMKTQYITIGQKKLAYDDSGKGPLIICLPSLGDVRAEYRYLVPELTASGFRVVTMDLRGMGESDAYWPSYNVTDMGNDVLKLIHHLQSGPAIIIGTSKSAGSAICAAAEEPGLVKGLVLISPVARDITDTMPLWAGKLLFTFLFLNPWGRWVWKKYYPTLYPSHRPGDFDLYLKNLITNLKEPGRLTSVRKMITSSNRASDDRIHEITIPVQIIMGSKDPDFKNPEKEARYLVRQMKDSKYTIIPDVGHYPHAEIPEKANPLIISFLNSLSNLKDNAKKSTD